MDRWRVHFDSGSHCTARGQVRCLRTAPLCCELALQRCHVRITQRAAVHAQLAPPKVGKRLVQRVGRPPGNMSGPKEQCACATMQSVPQASGQAGLWPAGLCMKREGAHVMEVLWKVERGFPLCILLAQQLSVDPAGR